MNDPGKHPDAHPLHSMNAYINRCRPPDQFLPLPKTINVMMRKVILILLASLVLPVMLGCSQKNGNGTVLILELENSKNVPQYWVFNPYNRSIEECNATAEQAISQILASNAVPEDSKVKSWRCSFTPPENDK